MNNKDSEAAFVHRMYEQEKSVRALENALTEAWDAGFDAAITTACSLLAESGADWLRDAMDDLRGARDDRARG